MGAAELRRDRKGAGPRAEAFALAAEAIGSSTVRDAVSARMGMEAAMVEAMAGGNNAAVPAFALTRDIVLGYEAILLRTEAAETAKKGDAAGRA